MSSNNIPLLNIDGNSSDLIDNIDFFNADGYGIMDFSNLFKRRDSDSDGFIDIIFQVSDFNNDFLFDTEQILEDINGDGTADMILQAQYIDSNQNTIIDIFSFVREAGVEGYLHLLSAAQELNMDLLQDIVENYQNSLCLENYIPVYDYCSDSDEF